MAAPTNAASVKKALANSEPSTHGTKRTWASALHKSAIGGKADISRTLNGLFLSYIGAFPSADLSRYDTLS